ncbi:uncharacterized protein DUF4259 [Roseiarcus fermentans]|uniref:Uncharacterized protein DUF4259 n=1 Tax=Roseiarcus fermentans TaxID=1473586 RepID=A0A366F1N7_9HYPH|nr:DUF4259 domain-containing protein [Roseiarcus fermentans]RBP08551.1 uncharacterized protein DUF4259 [Roseiarcus fermentans]
MGAWGTGIFDNDTAADFAGAVAESGGVPALEAALDRALAAGDVYLEAPQAEEALAAAEIVARTSQPSAGPDPYTASVDAWIAANHPQVGAALRDKARRAIARVLTEPSELLEVWMESGQYEAWAHAVRDVSSRP